MPIIVIFRCDKPGCKCEEKIENSFQENKWHKQSVIGGTRVYCPTHRHEYEIRDKIDEAFKLS